MAENKDPAVSVRFKVEIDDAALGLFNTCEGLGLEVVIEQREEGGNNGFVWQLPTRIKYSNIKLSRPVGKESAQLTAWLCSFATGGQRHTAMITAMTVDGDVVATWKLDRVIPVRWSGPSLNPDTPKVATETVELAHHGFLPREELSMPKPIALMTSGKQAKKSMGAEPPPPASTVQAQLTLYDPSPAKGGGGDPGAERGVVMFQFNPKEVTISKSAKWERKPSKQSKTASPVQFLGADPSKMTLEMFFDATAARDGSVVKAVESLLSCCVPTEESHGQKKATPPIVVLHWGSISSFPAVVTSVSAKFTLFNADGTPIRAVCSVTLEEMPGEEFRKQNPTSGSHEVRRVHRTIAGDSLASVAFAEYGDPTAWRALAAFNEIDDPLRVPTGRVLLLPTPEELAPALAGAR